jgi:benzoylformate decarboxylase
MAIAAKHAFLEQLIADGTKYIFGNPGTTEQGVMDALQDHPEIKFILGLQEAVAVCMAEAYARATRKPAVVELHTSPGLGNGLGMVNNAMRGHTPLVVWVGQSDSRQLYTEPVLSGDLAGMAAPWVKWSVEAKSGDEVPMLTRRALKVAAEPPEGPVMISLPLDVGEHLTDEPVFPTTFTNARSRPDPEAVREAASIILNSRKPVIVAGDGVSNSQGEAELSALAELIGAPLHGGGSQMAIAFDNPLFSGAFDPMRDNDIDLLLAVGTTEPAPFAPPPVPPWPADARVIEIGTNNWELSKHQRTELGISADPKMALADLAEAIRAQMSPEQQQQASRRGEAAKERRKNDIARMLEEDQRRRDQTPIAGSRLMEELGKAIPDNAAIFNQGGTAVQGLDRYLKPHPGRVFGIRGGGIGPGMPGPLGLQLAFPDDPVVGICGDGSAMYTIQAIWSAAHHKLPVTWVICSNRQYRVLKVNMMRHLGEASAGRKFVEMDLFDPPLDFVGMATAMGARARQVQHPDELGDALREAIAHPGPALVDVVVDGTLPGRLD